MVDNWLNIRQFFKIGHCLSCCQPLSLFEDFCPACVDSLPYMQSHCPGCGESRPDQIGENLLCGQCQQTPRPFASVRALFHYQRPVATYIQQLKYRRRLDLARTLGLLMAKHLKSTDKTVDLIMPIPLHRSRLVGRGYNQALELARPIAKKLALPLDYKSLVRTRKTKSQTKLSIDARRKNIRHAFAVLGNKVAGKKIALIDDVFTTGLTAEAATHALRKSGATSVECWVLARAGLGQD